MGVHFNAGKAHSHTFDGQPLQCSCGQGSPLALHLPSLRMGHDGYQSRGRASAGTLSSLCAHAVHTRDFPCFFARVIVGTQGLAAVAYIFGVYDWHYFQNKIVAKRVLVCCHRSYSCCISSQLPPAMPPQARPGVSSLVMYLQLPPSCFSTHGHLASCWLRARR